MIGQTATIAMRTIEGATIRTARRRSGIPLERRRSVVAPALTEAASIVLEGVQRGVDLLAGLLDRVGRRHATGESVVDVLVDRLRDLRIHRRDRTRLRLAESGLELGRVRDRLLDRRIVVRIVEDRRVGVLVERDLLPRRRGDVVGELQRQAGVLRVDGDHAVVAAEDVGPAGALEGRKRSDRVLALHLAAAGLVRRVRVGPVAHEGVLAAGPGLVGLRLHVGRDRLRSATALDAVDHELQGLHVRRRVERRLLAGRVQDLAAGGEAELEEVTGQALVRRALVDDAALLGGLLVDGLPRRRGGLELVRPVEQERRVARRRHAPVLVGGMHGLERRRDVLRAELADVRRQVVEPLLARELRRPDHVGVEHVAVVALRLLALDELRALLVGGCRELGQDGLVARARVLRVEVLDELVGRTVRVLAGAVVDGALRRTGHRVGVDDLRTVDRDGAAAAAAAAAAGAAAAAAAAAATAAAARGGEHRERHDDCRAQTKATSHATPPPGTYIAQALTGFRKVTGEPVLQAGTMHLAPPAVKGG